RSTAWYSGADATPPVLIGAPEHPLRGPVAEVLAGVRAGQEAGLARAGRPGEHRRGSVRRRPRRTGRRRARGWW
ncbi:hypothetical protein, partial [Nakamurella sp.]|uniref:hypothetical protein n=1 Tax=Nakamurella sp. TaxID=1869182 RepID=UPI003B3B0E3A